MTFTAKHKHFWLRITPTADLPGTTVLGALICEDNEQSIGDAVITFISASNKKIGTNWTVEITRPNHSPVFQAATVADFYRGTINRRPSKDEEP